MLRSWLQRNRLTLEVIAALLVTCGILLIFLPLPATIIVTCLLAMFFSSIVRLLRTQIALAWATHKNARAREQEQAALPKQEPATPVMTQE